MVLAVSTRIRSSVLPALGLAVIAVGLSACGSSNGAGSTQSFKGPAYEVTTSVISGLGTILVDGKGYSLYLFEPDHQSGKSTCYVTCAVDRSPAHGAVELAASDRRDRCDRLQAVYDPPTRRHDPGDLQRVAPVPVGAGHVSMS